MDRVRGFLLIAAAALTAGCGTTSANPAGDQQAQSQSAAAVAKPGTTASAAIIAADLPSPNGLAGETAIADNFDTAPGIEPSNWQINGVPQVAPPSKEDVGAFRMYCAPGQLLKDDPLVYPGQPGASHLHQFVGNSGTNANSTYASLRTTGGTSCGAAGTPFNRSAYWIPAMLDGAGSAVKPDYMLLYYKREPASSPQCTDPVARRGICTDLPNGIRYVFGYNMKTGTNGPTDINAPEYWNIAFFCWGAEDGSVGDGGATARYRTIKDVVDAGCPVGAQLIITGFAPNCWDGTTLDAADHRSNVVYAAKLDAGLGIRCDDAHPYLIPDMQFQWHYTVDSNFRAGKWHLSSDEMVPGAPAGTTMHMDYWEAWSPLKAVWEKNCINGHLTCASGDLGDTTEIKGAGMPVGGFPKHQLAPVP